MLIKKPADIRSSEITDRKSYLNRREFLARPGNGSGPTVDRFGGTLHRDIRDILQRNNFHDGFLPLLACPQDSPNRRFVTARR